MKNYFSSVIVPVSSPSAEKLSIALTELVDQLRVTVNSIDLDNMNDKTVKEITSGKIRVLTEQDIAKNRLGGVKKGDLVVVAGTANGRLSAIEGMYICTVDQ